MQEGFANMCVSVNDPDLTDKAGPSDKPVFSIIVPVYNTAQYLEACVASLLQQTLPDLEVILVDDGSTDGSGALCDDLAARDERVRVLHKANAGQGLARNDGLDTARGEYVLFIDSDDTIEPDSCEVLRQFMEENHLQLCSFGYIIEDRDGNEVTRPSLTTHIYEGDEVRSRFVPHYFGDSPEDPALRGVSSCMTAFRRDVIEEGHARFPSEREVLSEDTLFSLKVCYMVERAGVLARYLYHYYQNPSSFSHTYRPDRFDKTLKLCDLLRGEAVSYHLEETVEVRIHMQLWVSLMECIRQEVRRTDTGRREIHRKVKEYCDHEATQEAAQYLRGHALGRTQKVFLFAVRHRWYPAVELMAWLRNRRGL